MRGRHNLLGKALPQIKRSSGPFLKTNVLWLSRHIGSYRLKFTSSLCHLLVYSLHTSMSLFVKQRKYCLIHRICAKIKLDYVHNILYIIITQEIMEVIGIFIIIAISIIITTSQRMTLGVSAHHGFSHDIQAAALVSLRESCCAQSDGIGAQRHAES